MGSDAGGKAPPAMLKVRRWWEARSMKEKVLCGAGTALLVRTRKRSARARAPRLLRRATTPPREHPRTAAMLLRCRC
jgi:hypothetical protein